MINTLWASNNIILWRHPALEHFREQRYKSFDLSYIPRYLKGKVRQINYKLLKSVGLLCWNYYARVQAAGSSKS